MAAVAPPKNVPLDEPPNQRDAVKPVRPARWIPRALIGPVALLLAWGIAAGTHVVSAKLLPGSIDTLASLRDSLLSGDMFLDVGPTLQRVMFGFVIAVAVGLPIGIVLGASQKLYKTVEFLIDFFRSTPVTALFPLFLLIFGIGNEAKIAVAAFAAGLVIVFNVAYGVMSAAQTRIMAATVMGASRTRRLRDVLFFESLPQTMIGLRTGVSIALVVIIVAEMFVGADRGMGRRIIDAQQVFDLTNMYASIVVTGVMGYGLNRLFLELDNRLIHWSGR